MSMVWPLMVSLKSEVRDLEQGKPLQIVDLKTMLTISRVMGGAQGGKLTSLCLVAYGSI